jgi:hypothetical protein
MKGIDNKLECDVGLCYNVVKFTREPSFEETHGDENSILYKLELREVKVDIHNEASKVHILSILLKIIMLL